jgi:hypothetical protein
VPIQGARSMETTDKIEPVTGDSRLDALEAEEARLNQEAGIADEVQDESDLAVDAEDTVLSGESTVGNAADDAELPQHAYVSAAIVDLAPVLDELGAAGASLKEASGDAKKLAESTTVLANRLRDNANKYANIVKSYDEILQQKNRHLVYMMAGCVCVILVSLLLAVYMSASFGKQVTNMNALSLNLGRRIAEVNSGLVTFEELNSAIQSLDASVLGVATALETQSASLQGITVELGEAEAENFSRMRDMINAQATGTTNAVEALRSSTAQQSAALQGNNASLQSLQEEVLSLRATVESVLVLRESVDALVTLQKERYFDVIAQQQLQSEQQRSEELPVRFQREAEVPQSAP